MTGLTYRSKQTKLCRYRKANGIEIYTDAAPVRDHIHALNALNVNNHMIAAPADCTPQYVHQISRGEVQRVRIDIAQPILALTHLPHHKQNNVLGVGATRRIRALNAIGWPTAELAPRLNISAARTLNQSMRHTLISYQRWASIRDLYDTLSGAPGPSDHSRTRARVDGHLPPLAWEDRDIDHPHALPDWAAAGIPRSQWPYCGNGHKYTPENTAIVRGGRACRQCARDAKRRATKRRST